MAFSSLHPFTEAVNCFYSALVSTLMISADLYRRKSSYRRYIKRNFNFEVANKKSAIE